ncbi:unnamed protein product [Amoebophrya sp. A120]|nr:unnamed protein product [Amoebophrya sp. A120]|eukprot:GSA120T00003857001.1
MHPNYPHLTAPAQLQSAAGYATIQKRLPNPVIVANEAIGYVSMCNDTRWRSYSQEDLINRVKENRQKFIGKEFTVGFTGGKLQGKKIQVCGMDQTKFHCEVVSDSSSSESGNMQNRNNFMSFTPSSRVSGPNMYSSPQQDAKYNMPSPSVDEYYMGGSSSSSANGESNKSRSPKRLSMAQRQMQVNDRGNATHSTTAGESSGLESGVEVVKLQIGNLVPVGSAHAAHEAAQLARAFPGPYDMQQVRSSSWNGNLTFERVERKVQQAIFFFKGQPPVGAKDQTIFNRELFQSLNARYRTDELHRLDILEILLKAKKVSFFQVQCKELCLWEDEEKNIQLDKVNIETNTKRLRIKNMDAARHKHKMKEQNVMYGMALQAVRPACVGNGLVNFAQFDYGLTRDAKFENQIYTRFVKFVKYGMCERCQHYYLERGSQQQAQQQQQASAGNPVAQQQRPSFNLAATNARPSVQLFQNYQGSSAANSGKFVARNEF